MWEGSGWVGGAGMRGDVDEEGGRVVLGRVSQ